jgi:hypothetical protein
LKSRAAPPTAPQRLGANRIDLAEDFSDHVAGARMFSPIDREILVEERLGITRQRQLDGRQLRAPPILIFLFRLVTVAGGSHCLVERRSAITTGKLPDEFVVMAQHQTDSTIGSNYFEVGPNAVAKRQERNGKVEQSLALGPVEFKRTPRVCGDADCHSCSTKRSFRSSFSFHFSNSKPEHASPAQTNP